MTDLTITHTPEDGTLIEGTSKGDGSAEALKANGWRWSGRLGSWFVPRSRDVAPKRHVVDPTVRALEAAGFSVEVELEERRRSTAQVEADKIARQDERVAALEAKAQRRRAGADAAWDRAQRDGDRLPEGGEPIKVGHHSEGRHRRAMERAHVSMGRAVGADREAELAEARAQTSAHTTGARYAPVTVANRIKKEQAEIRRVERALAGGLAWRGTADEGYYQEHVQPEGEHRVRLAAELAQLADSLAYWQQVRDEQVEAGQASNYGPQDVAAGDAVKIGGRWRRVKRANKKSVSVETGYSWTDLADYATITDHRKAADLA